MIYAVARLIYNSLYTILLPLVFFRLWLRGRRLPSYKERWSERLGFVPFPPLENVIWLHAVSVGEIVSVIPLIRSLQESTSLPILVTTTTPTGSSRLQAAFKDKMGSNLYHCYFPFDIFWVWSKFFSRINPKLLILMETEIWPSLLHQCKVKNIPVIIANARLSPKSCQRYRNIRNMLKEILDPVRIILTQSELDKQNFVSIGYDESKTKSTGNIKFDLNLPIYLDQEAKTLRQHLGDNRYVFVAASTHDGEEEIIISAYKKLKKDIPELLCLLVPRHPDRFKQVSNICLQSGLKISTRSGMQPVSPDVDIFLGDSMGEMLLFYATSDLAFVAGSLKPIGGHNLLEPAALGLAILTGHHLFNFREISQKLFNNNGAILVNNEMELVDNILKLYKNPLEAAKIGKNALQVIEDNKGAMQRQINEISRYLT
jgi:3-deoxy-D-manno-octulosonic-acid transferase